ncbi:MAG TPA: hypothetical protein VG013_03585 [Gemmataceae bacterium]|jgi:hypothetical protein|nr:hypothetical protein [Gemmataceae bacterium]
MDHVHEEDRSTYYLEQLCMIGMCAALGGVAIAMGPRGMLDKILAPKFHLPVLLGGYALLALAAVRAVALWQSVGKIGSIPAQHHNHDHEHGHDHEHASTTEPHVHSHEAGHDCGDCDDHDHAGLAVPHDHDHDHGHSHSWNPLRYVFLMLPVVLFFLNLPNQGLLASGEQDVQGLGGSEYGKGGDPNVLGASMVGLGVLPPGSSVFSTLGAWAAAQAKEGDVIHLAFKELDEAAYDTQRRAYYQGRQGSLKGQLAHTADDRIFSLVRYKMTCCAADAIPVRVVIVAPQSVRDIQQNKWVEVTGQIQFRDRPDHNNEIVPVLQVSSMKNIREIPPEPSIYLP